MNTDLWFIPIRKNYEFPDRLVDHLRVKFLIRMSLFVDIFQIFGYVCIPFEERGVLVQVTGHHLLKLIVMPRWRNW